MLLLAILAAEFFGFEMHFDAEVAEVRQEYVAKKHYSTFTKQR